MTVARETDQHGERSLNPVEDFLPAPLRQVDCVEEAGNKCRRLLVIQTFLSIYMYFVSGIVTRRESQSTLPAPLGSRDNSYD
jgi:hypothetical protein